MRLATCLAVLVCLALAACGDEDVEQPASAPAPAETRVDVRVTGAGEPRSFTCGDGCDTQAVAAALAGSADATRVCTDIYGGKETAQVTGTLDGEPVDVTVARSDGCGIADYEALFKALGEDPPLATP